MVLNSGGFHGSNWFISSSQQLLYYLTSFSHPVDTKSVSPSSVLHLFLSCLLPLCLFLSKNLDICIFPKPSFLVFIRSWSASFLSTHPVCKALTHMSLLPSWHLTMQETCQKVIVFINIVGFICLEGRRGFPDLKCRTRFPSLLSVFIQLFWQPRQEQGSMRSSEPAAG